MMSFLSTIFLWALPLTLVPVVIHLFNRRRRTVIRWGAMRFLMEHVTRRRRIWRVDDLLLMLLRAMVVLAFVLALARPQLRATWLGSSEIRDVVLVLDTSMSTSRTTGKATAFAEMVGRAEIALDELGPRDMVRAMIASTTPRWISPAAATANTEAKRNLSRQLSTLKPTLASAAMLDAVQHAIDAEPVDEAASRFVIIVTDDQAYGWRAGTPDAWRGIAESIESAARPTVVNVLRAAGPQEAAANLSVDKVEAKRVLAGVHEKLGLSATVRNAGQTNAHAAILNWRSGDEELGVCSVPALGPGEAARIGIEHRFSKTGVFHVQCVVEADDDLAMDNEGSVIVEVVDTAAILVVEQDAQADPLKTDTGYFLAALGPDASHDASSHWRSVFRPKVIDVYELDQEELDHYHAIVLANVSQLEAAAMRKMTEFVRNGGGLWIALGDKTMPQAFNDAFYAEGEGLSPLAVGDSVGDVDNLDKFVVIHPPLTAHPATDLISDTQRLDLDQVKLRRRRRFIDGADDEEVSVLLRTEGGAPLVVERFFGRGRVIVQAVPLGIRWSNLPLCQVYVAMVHEWLWYLIQPAATPRNVQVADPLVLTLPAKFAKIAAQVTMPTGGVADVTATIEGDRSVYRFKNTLLPGLYTFALSAPGLSQDTWPYYVRRDPAESGLAALSESDEESLAEAGNVRFVTEPLARPTGHREEPRAEPLWTWLLGALIVLIVIELLFAALMTRRRARPGPAPPSFAE